MEVHSVAIVSGNDIARAGSGQGVAHDIRRSTGNSDTIDRVGDGDIAGRIGADEVALDHVAGRGASMNENPVASVGRNDVADPDYGAPDGVVAGVIDFEPIQIVAQSDCAPNCVRDVSRYL